MERRDFIKTAWAWLLVLAGTDLFAKNHNPKEKLEKHTLSINRKIILTIDDGPSKFTVSIAEELNKHNMKWIFFLLWENIARYEKNVEEILKMWHKIWNHSYNHPNFARISLDKAKDQVTRTDDILRWILAKTWQNPKQNMHFRYPYGNQVKEAFRWEFNQFLQSKKLESMFWDVDTNDWRWYKSAKNVYNTVSKAYDWNIVLVHDRWKTLKALKMFNS